MRRPTFFACFVLAACGPSVPPPAVRAVELPIQPPPPVAPPSSGAADEHEPEPVFAADATVAPFVMPAGAAQKQTPRATSAASQLLRSKWTARIGKTTFRTTMALAAGAIVVGTHGDTLGGQNETSDAVYVLDASTGKVTRKIAAPGKGDKDIGGVALDGAHVVFTTDNGLVVKAKLADGTVVWSRRLGGKVRPAPALGDLDGKGARDVVVGDEHGALHALSGDDGTVLWTAATGKNEYDASGFVAAAAIGDVDGDGKDDVVAGARDGALVAYRGATGDALWRVDGTSGIHASPSLVDLDGDGRREVLASSSYSKVLVLDARTGVPRYEQSLSLDDGGIEGLFASPVPLPVGGAAGLIVQPTAWWGGKRGQKSTSIDGVVLVGQLRRELRSDEGRVSASAVVVDLSNRGSWDAVVGTEAGELLSIAPAGTRTLLAKLGGPIEATAFAADVDGDGTYELLVASNDGVLTCFATSSRTKPLVSRFRGETPDNRGDLGRIPLGWAVSSAATAPTDRPRARR